MGQSKNLASYEDVREVLQQTIESTRGKAVECPSVSAAKALRFRLYAARRAEQRENCKRYPLGHVLHGKSYFDNIVITVEGSTVKLINGPAQTFNIRDL